MKRTAMLRRTPLQAKRPEPRPVKVIEYTPRPRPPAAPVAVVQATKPVPKEVRFESDDWLRAVASIRCVRCHRGTFNPDGFAQSQAAHRNEGKGGARKVDDCLAAALCPDCHHEIDQGKDMTREQRRAEIDRCIVLTLRELARRGHLMIVGVK